MPGNQNKLFANQKHAAISGEDFSRKGSVDEPIKELVDFINSSENYFTTSSCSGRILVLADNPDQEASSIQKEGCKWVYVSHGLSSHEEISPKLDPSLGDLTFKFEAFVLHVQCRTLEDAQIMLSCGVQAGFRNSGISLKSKKHINQDWPKIIVAIRSTHGIEAPLSAGGKMIVTPEYIAHVTSKANILMEENFKRISRFHQNFVKELRKD